MNSLLQSLLSFSFTSIRLFESANPSQQDNGTFVIGLCSHTRSELATLARRTDVNILRIRDRWLDTHFRYYPLVPSHSKSTASTEDIVGTQLVSNVHPNDKVLLWIKNPQRQRSTRTCGDGSRLLWRKRWCIGLGH